MSGRKSTIWTKRSNEAANAESKQEAADKRMELSYAYASHRGNVRRMNQDNLICLGHYLPMGSMGTEDVISGAVQDQAGALFGVFDGMGGEQRGEAASFLAAQHASVTDPGGKGQALLQCCLEANRAICAFTAENGLKICGTTAAMALFRAGRAWLCNVGDSRIYRLRQGSMTQLSVDHVMPGYPSMKPPLFQFLGIPETEMRLEPQITETEVLPGDGYLLCSDGLTDMVEAGGIQAVLSSMPPREAVRQLMARALENGGRDNVTAIYVQAASPDRKRLFRFFSS